MRTVIIAMIFLINYYMESISDTSHAISAGML